ncbi:MAG: MFS transporter [Chloroflexota bacterium]|nr:MFS transporter [Chloroflexota bacterium]
MSAQNNSPTQSSAERWVLIAAILASAMAFIDQSALDVASPRLQADLGMSGTQLFWVSTAYALMLASLLLVGGALGDLYGRKRVFMIGIGIFTAASIACGLAPTADLLIVARAAQGIGGALMVPGSLALISATFSADKRGTAIGTWSTFATLTTLLGPLLGGWLAERGLWRAVFLINVPFGLIALYLLATRVAESRDETGSRQLDIVGAILITLSLALFTIGFTVIQGGEGILPMLTIVGAVVALIAFIFVESRAAHPMVPLSLFRDRTFTGTNLLTLFLYGALRVCPFFVGLTLQQVQGYPADVAGFAFLPLALCLIAMSRFAGGWVTRIGARILLTVGPALAGVGFFLLGLPGLTAGPADYWTSYFPGILVLGIGLGLTVAPLTTTVMGSAPRENAGAASGINNAVSRVAAVLALTLIGGFALGNFQSTLGVRADDIAMSAEQRAEMMANSDDLGATQPPDGIDAAMQTEVTDAIKLSFLDAQRLVSIIAAVLAWISAAIAWMLIAPRVPGTPAAVDRPVLVGAE